MGASHVEATLAYDDPPMADVVRLLLSQGWSIRSAHSRDALRYDIGHETHFSSGIDEILTDLTSANHGKVDLRGRKPSLIVWKFRPDDHHRISSPSIGIWINQGQFNYCTNPRLSEAEAAVNIERYLNAIRFVASETNPEYGFGDLDVDIPPGDAPLKYGDKLEFQRVHWLFVVPIGDDGWISEKRFAETPGWITERLDGEMGLIVGWENPTCGEDGLRSTKRALKAHLGVQKWHYLR